MSMDQQVQNSLDQLRRQLLNLSGRNQLLNFKFSERSRTQVRLVDRLPNQVFEALEQDQSITITALPEPSEHPEDENDDSFRLLLETMRDCDEEYISAMQALEEQEEASEEYQQIERMLRDKVRVELGMPPWKSLNALNKREVAMHHDIHPDYDVPALQSNEGGKASHWDKTLQTLLYPEELNRKLAGLREGARKSLQEMGINTLCLAFGMLEWYESDQSDKKLLAPLLLYQADLERQLRDGNYVYTVKSYGEEIEENFNLREKLRRDYGIELPPFISDTSNPEDYFEQISRLIERRSRWQVRRFLTLSLFSFHGIALFQDLNPERWPDQSSILHHPLVERVLCGQDIIDLPETIAQDYDVDSPNISRKIPLFITDADASQFSAIVDAVDGKNLVIEGPPGTGKSQTITNLIAATLAQGKRVLFVAEKKAALEVVYNRLADAGLENYCLEMHSATTSKKPFYENLKQRVQQDLPSDVSQELANKEREYGDLKKKLSRYVQLINQPFGRISKTIQEILWAAQRANDLSAEISQVSTLLSIRDDQAISMTEADFQCKVQHLKEFSSQHKKILQQYEHINNHPWSGVQAHNLSPIDQGDLLASTTSWFKTLNQIQAYSQNQIRDFLETYRSSDIQTPDSLERLNHLQAQLQVCPSVESLVEIPLLSALRDSQSQQSIIQLIKYLQDYSKKKEELKIFFRDNITSLPNELNDLLTISYQDIENNFELVQSIVQIISDQFTALCNSSSYQTLIDARSMCEDLLRLRSKLQKYDLSLCKDTKQVRTYVDKFRQVHLFSFLDSEYRQAKKFWAKIQKQPTDLSNPEIANILKQISDYQEKVVLLSKNSSLKHICGNFFKGLETDFDALMTINVFANGLKQRFDAFEIARQALARSEAINILGYFYQEENTNLERLEATLKFTKSVCQSPLPQAIKNSLLSPSCKQVAEMVVQISKTLADYLNQEVQHRNTFLQQGQIDTEEMFAVQDVTHLSLEQIIHRLHSAISARDDLPAWVNYHQAYQQVDDDGLLPIVEAFEQENLDLSYLGKAYPFIFYRSLLRFVYQEYPELNQFSGITQAQVRQQFQQADQDLLNLYKKQLVAQLAQVSIEPGNSRGRRSDWTEMALIQNEIHKQKRHLPPRKLFQRAALALQQLKPCWMMSPASVAKFIPAGAVTFDIAIIDEASQMRPAEALGTIARSSQMVVVGDPKQLPPTDFFRTQFDPDDGEETDSDVLNEESILDMALKVFYPARQLKWHYRSRHESLIAFSNQHFYNNSLTIFPSPNEKFAVEYHYVKSGAYKSRANVPEAMTVAQFVEDLIRQNPDFSLGVVTLNQKQQELLLDEMDRIFALNPDLEEYRARRDNTLEPFFIKNLENVQGDERDIIVISTVYGPERPGMPVMQRFGPINNQNGHRRLNVLFTRAKERIIVFSSMKPSDIKPSPTSNQGVHILRAYLEYAQTKKLQTATTTGREPDSDFEIFVADRLRRHGYNVVPQVGVSGYFIDLAVIDPQRPGRYLLGVECDGATYHSSKAARDRDRLRQQVLERLGWKLYRIWSTDWFTNPSTETEKLIQYINALQDNP